MKLVNVVHELVSEHLHAGDIAIDATVGNGHDTLFLAQRVVPYGRVYGFDIQQVALDKALEKCQAAEIDDCLTLFAESHAEMCNKIPIEHHGKIKACLFNLGYLPGGDKAIITQTASTIKALDSASELLAPSGIITVLAYPGHSGGDLETASVEYWCKKLETSDFELSCFVSDVHKPKAPRLFVLQKQQDCVLS